MSDNQTSLDKRNEKNRVLSRRQFLSSSFGAFSLLTLSVNGLNFFTNSSPKGPDFKGRIDALINKMTLEEKVSQLRYDAPAIQRLDIPEYTWWNECLHGVARAGYATVFPQAIGMAAAWDAPLLQKVADAISDEARAKHHAAIRHNKRDIYTGLTFWSPNINIVRDPRWGRGQETYGEDPYLTGQLAKAFIQGLQGDHPEYYKVVATAKHFAVYNGPEPLRHQINIDVSDHDLWETYLPAFKTSVEEAKVASVMCAYNSLRGMPCCGNNPLLESILREDWGFDGYVVSDCGAIEDFYNEQDHHVVSTPEEAAAKAIDNGTDLNCGETFPHLKKAVEQGLISEDQIDQSLRRLLEARFRLGMFDDPSEVPYANIPYSVVDSPEHRHLALQLARESIVLLKNDSIDNDHPVLPLNKDLKDIAVIGPNADYYWAMLGNYHGTPGFVSTPLNGIQETVSSQTNVHYALGSNVAEGIPRLVPIDSDYLLPAKGSGSGLYAEYFDNENFSGNPSVTRIDNEIDFVWLDDTPVSGKMYDPFSTRWTGKIKAPVSGTYVLDFLAMRSLNGYRLYFDGKLIKSKGKFGKERGNETTRVDMEAGQTYDIKIEYYNIGPDPQAHLIWHTPGQDLLGEAKEAVQKSEVAVLCMGLNSQIEGEEMNLEVEGFKGGDRTKIKLPDTQIQLIEEISQMGKPIVLVLMSGSAVSVGPVSRQIPTVLQAWYGGQAGGKALAEVLFGDYNPAGRLPETFYESVDDLPSFTDYSMENRTYKYFQGKPFYPFGHGLSYTKFSYSDLNVPDSINRKKAMDINVKLTNAGDRTGDEVVQVYVTHPESKMQKPARSLQGFKRISLKAGETKQVHFRLEPNQLALVDDTGSLVQPKEKLRIAVGGKQPGFTGNIDAQTTEVIEREVQVI
ncbi:MAG TPA: glycoside hydrolase family 3 C-terminal domain-containing protein [Balneolaceae bacterium]|nr:glycoside hydrolase family 3 C-terminal domain-containing protein [Balneolaceae bacterium]